MLILICQSSVTLFTRVYLCPCVGEMYANTNNQLAMYGLLAMAHDDTVMLHLIYQISARDQVISN